MRDHAHRLMLAAAVGFVAIAPARGQDLEQAAAAALDLSACQVQRIEPAPGPEPGWLRAALTLDGAPVEVVLWPHSVRAEDFRLVEWRDGQDVDVAAGPPRTWRGVVAGDVDSAVAGSISADGHVWLSIDLGGGERWQVQPMADVDADAQAALSIVYAASAARAHWECGGAIRAAASDDGGVTERGVGCPIRVATIEFTADVAYQDERGPGSAARIEAMVNAASMVYEDQLSTRLLLNGIRLLGSDPWPSTSDAGALLNSFDVFIASTPPLGSQRDLAHLASGVDFDGFTAGLAFLDSICIGHHNTGIGQYTHANAVDVMIFAHEAGHNFGAGHDGLENACSIEGFIMAPTSDALVNPWFSTCSVSEITPRLGRPCLTAPGVEAVRDHFLAARDTRRLMDVLPNDLTCVGGSEAGGTLSLLTGVTSAGGTVQVAAGAGPGGRDVLDYTPPADFVGIDTLSYQLHVGAATSSTTVIVQVASEIPLTDRVLCPCACFIEYRADTGGVLGLNPGVPAGSSYMWMKRFTVLAGAEDIIQIEAMAFASFPVERQVMLGLFSDPNQDGNPSDAVLVASAGPFTVNNANSPATLRALVPPSMVGAVGDFFFVAAGTTHDSSFFPITDGTGGTGSFIVRAPVGDVLPGTTVTSLTNDFNIRAIGGAVEDCNDNGFADVCEIAEVNAPDLDGNGVIDDCETTAPCLCETTGESPASVNVFDLLGYLDLWFAGSPAADIDGAAGVNVFDLLVFLDCWFPASAGGACP